MKCEVELPNRAQKGKPTPCGKPAGTYRMSGEIAWVDATVCEFHAKMLKLRGYTLEMVDPVDQERIAS